MILPVKGSSKNSVLEIINQTDIAVNTLIFSGLNDLMFNFNSSKSLD